MQIVIDIPEKIYNDIKSKNKHGLIFNAVKNGTLQKKGKWINLDGTEKWQCSECERIMWFPKRLSIKAEDYKFCPNCGADMGGDANADSD